MAKNKTIGRMRLACAFAVLGSIPLLAQTATETVLHNFGNFPNGAIPNGTPIRDAEGNLYGTASLGGAANLGVVFKLDADGHYRVLHSFQGGADGADPSGVIRDPAGNLYGTTASGGAANAGVVFELDPSGKETVLYTFTGGADGATPSGVTRDPEGNLYGATNGGGVAAGYFGFGVVYRLDPSGHQTVLHRFTSGADGATPNAGLVRDWAGNLYGTAYGGGSDGQGVIYKLDPLGRETVLHNFSSPPDGINPLAGVIRDSAGNLYGTTALGGLTSDRNVGGGVVYELEAAGAYHVLYRFQNSRPFPRSPQAQLLRDSYGNLYGTTEVGGPASSGAVFRLDTAGEFSVLYAFPGGGIYDLVGSSGVILDPGGNIYGTTTQAGPAGMIYKLNPSNIETTLYSFLGAAGGTGPDAGVVRDSAGNLYGNTYYGGAANAGVVYKMDAEGHETVLHSFTGGADGEWPMGSLAPDSAGSLYGTTNLGGVANRGVVYKVDSSGNETVLHSFTGGADGGEPYAGVTRDPDGNLYGTASSGGLVAGDCGNQGCGVVYQVSPSEVTGRSLPELTG